MQSNNWSYNLPQFYNNMMTPHASYYFPSYPLTTSLNSSSGYETSSRDNSIIESGYVTTTTPPPGPKTFSTPIDQQQYNDSAMDDATDEFYLEPAQRQTSNVNRCKKRRILSRPQRQEANRRERQRMDIINQAYDDLRNVLPFKKGRKRQRMSRMDTVDGAIRYIESLLELLHGSNAPVQWKSS